MSDTIIGIDAAKMREGRDETGYCIGGYLVPAPGPRYQMIRNGVEARDEYGYRIELPTPSKPIFRVFEAGELKHEPGIVLQDVIGLIMQRGKAWGAKVAAGDDYESTSVAGVCTQHQIRFIPYAWTNASKEEAIGTIRRMVREGSLSIEPHQKLRAEMLGLKFRITRSGVTDYRTHGKDLVSSLISIAHYLNDPDAAGLSDQTARPLTGTPFRAFRGGRQMISKGY
jgi:hypothetical protein